MPYPRAIGSGLGAAHGQKIISKPYPFGSDIHGYPCPWVKLPSLAEMEATTIGTQCSVVGRVAAEHYFEEVLEGARSIEAQCSKNIMF